MTSCSGLTPTSGGPRTVRAISKAQLNGRSTQRRVRDMTNARSKRVSGSGNLGRWLVIPTWGPTVIAMVSYIPSRLGGHYVAIDGNPLGAFLFLAFGVFFVVNSCLLGVWISEDRVLLRSWFRSWSVRRDDVAGCRSVPYSGFLTSWDWDGSGRFIKIVEITSVSGKAVAVRGLIAGKTRNNVQVGRIQRLLRLAEHAGRN